VSLNEIIDPLDYEEFLIQHTNVLCRDVLRSILDFQVNVNDVQVKILPRKIRTLEHIVPKEDLNTLPLYVQHCVDCFTRPWKTVQFNQRHHSSSASIRSSSKDVLTPSAFQQGERSFFVANNPFL
jgi:dedicator of cytokinesis protein 6/7/8